MASEEEVIAHGDWYPPNSNGSIVAQLVSRSGEVIAQANEGAVHSAAPFAALSFSSRVGSIPRRVTFPDRSVFETRDNDAVDAFLRARGRKAVSRAYHLERFHPRILLFALCVVLLAFGTYRFALPAMVEVAVLVTPPVVPQLISSGAINALDNTAFSPSRLSANLQQDILERFERVSINAQGGVRGYKLNFRSGGLIGPNAFALPDGNIVLTDELVEMAGGDTEMIAAVLAHEIGHVEHKHSLRQIYRAAGIAGLVMLIAGDVGSGVEDVLTQGGGLLALSYSRSAESEADRRSVELMRRSGMDPAAIVRFFDMIETKLGDHSETSMLSTHPGTPERKEAILKYAGNAN
ncbi:Peptidase family M48 [Rhizobium mongolense subsp. loessense]|uniref:Peptidase family M48 n=1 Tax=Rhizobium mongolense subsp. loessense TaxID=158890 RepID=A0A1G4PMQ8_9HYPH|nr:M48 family metallopeptidase [Rhizobium mongolense]SCW33471.1 Peptidase family M48 [Rhizobium mongolense subsp. loessense]